MRNERKYKIITLMTVLLSVFLLGNCVREYWRLEAAEARQHQIWVLKGAKVYAENCIQCHGPRGEGVIGMPLNMTQYKVDHEAPAGKEAYNIISSAVRAGRKGNDAHFQWERTPDGKWISYSTMPAWGKDFGGPLDDDYVKAVTLFIMNPDGSQWDLIGTEAAPVQPASFPRVGGDPNGAIDQAKLAAGLPKGTLDEATSAAARTLMANVPKSQCLSCHVVGEFGGKIGPDLTYVGSWGIDQPFLERWIKYPGGSGTPPGQAMPHDERMPVYWSANRAATQPTLNLKDKIVSEGPYYMPRVNLTDAEVTLLSRYLLSLKAGK